MTTEQFSQEQAERERFGLLVNPDLTYRRIVFDEDSAREMLGGGTDGVVEVAFDRDGNRFHAIYRVDAGIVGAEPNPVASLARNTAETDTPEFLTDPTRSICGPVIFAARGGGSISEGTVEEVVNAIRAVENFRNDNPEEFELWRNAVKNR
ncbi:hypothetical protein HMPREF3171_01940 [Corynebacterium sp. HMSC08F01]|uniref:hypothetical protein n=1 Tax=Corynebacterium TaxID=1716 RepID=UPI0008A400A7|nr:MULTISPECIES: hypothetical protein [Corynebacterium]OFL14433.1 hypothetical protein HMPREF2785_03810 [Corynebacterium sp. HMSC067D03]OFT31632.1 hypothetical protein HMPREF3171_01940 [Corynebacterium sp. HMSC08F01]OFT68884.1 hypothetical protein HMPREF3145_08345 [Corynebacterium sp. HMSC05C01]OFU57409.1 hypothetical protein HMPREF3120_02430 [Corynebacterium sp. HMSC11D10]OHO32697.1 hypothetical protein HMPREF2690_09050 [Corynebacterium sp. HMSC034E11]